MRIGLFRDWVFKNPTWDPRTFDWDKDVTTVDAAFPMLNAMSTDYRAFKARGGKLIMYTGLADPVASPLDTIEYYDSVVKANGGIDGDAALLSLLPRSGHGALWRRRPARARSTRLPRWRHGSSSGISPDTIPASHSINGRVDRTRPLCAYPAVARYNGSGSIDDAANFSCLSGELPDPRSDQARPPTAPVPR